LKHQLSRIIGVVNSSLPHSPWLINLEGEIEMIVTVSYPLKMVMYFQRISMGIRCVLLSLMLLFGMIHSVFAMRCETKLVYEGDTKFDVTSKCGEPLNKDSYQQSVPIYNSEGYQIGMNTTTVETWTYQKSPQDFRYDLIFEGGILKEINANLRQ
jgi:hypothetical protein